MADLVKGSKPCPSCGGEAEIARLRAEVEHWFSLANKRAIEIHDQRKRAEAAEARVKDLEAS